MKKPLYRTTLAILVALVAVASLAVAYAAAGDAGAWARTLECVRAHQREALFGAAAGFLLVLLHVSSGFRRRPPDKILSFPNAEGAVSIGLGGIADFLSRMHGEFDTVTSIRPRVVVDQGELDVTLDVRIVEGPHVRQVCEQLQAEARRRLREGLGIQEVRHVTVQVLDFAPGKPASWSSPVSARKPGEAAKIVSSIEENDHGSVGV